MIRGAGVNTGTQCAGECGGKGMKCDCSTHASSPEVDAYVKHVVDRKAEVYRSAYSRSTRYKKEVAPAWREWIHVVSREVAQSVGMRPPEVNLMRPAKAWEDADFETVEPLAATVLGVADTLAHRIWLLDGEDRDTTLMVLGHELAHLHQAYKGKRLDEASADAIGAKVLKEYRSLIRRHEIKTMRGLCPEGTFDEFDAEQKELAAMRVLSDGGPMIFPHGDGHDEADA